MKLVIKKIKKVPAQYGNDLNISMVRLEDDNGKYIRFIKLDDELIEILLNTKIDIGDKLIGTPKRKGY